LIEHLPYTRIFGAPDIFKLGEKLVIFVSCIYEYGEYINKYKNYPTIC